jgi:hypothetical protein
MSGKNSKRTHNIIRLICFIVILACAFVATTQIDYTAFVDNISSIGYEASQELDEIINDLSLTKDGQRILLATRPELQDATNFNKSCISTDTSSSILGCYTNNRVYVYNIKNDSLPGIRQATLAHELLHAVWHRMSNDEHVMLGVSLKQVYDSDEDIREHLKLYSEEDFYDELHSVVGSQVAPERLPEDLRNHYAKYFKDQSKISQYYQQYSKIFKAA